MLNKRFLHKIETFISNGSLLDKHATHIVALSGGADSVAMLLALKQLGYSIEAAHCNFHLRGAESDRDEHFCAALCQANAIQLHTTHFDTREFARLRKISIEMAARHLRYTYFARLREDIGAADTCVAHHQEDSVETILMNLIRGTGLHGLKGISPQNGHIVRPMLCVTRSDIEQVLREAGQEYVTDSTNLINDVTRNKIRLDIIPLMRQINPSVGEAIMRAGANVARMSDMIDKILAEAVGNMVTTGSDGTMTISAEALLSGPSPQDVLFTALNGCSFTPAQVAQVYRAVRDKATGRTFYSPTHSLLVSRGRIIVEPADRANIRRNMHIPEDGLYVYGDNIKFRVETMAAPPTNPADLRAADYCHIDAAKIKWPLTVRPANNGDRFVPFGMKGSKLVSDFLTDLKLNLFDKQRQLVLCDVNGIILWVIGLRSDNRNKIKADTTTTIRIKLIKG